MCCVMQYGQTPLDIAAFYGRVAVVRLLLQVKANVNCTRKVSGVERRDVCTMVASGGGC